MPKWLYLVFIDKNNSMSLCEGGVYVDDGSIRVGQYSDNSHETARATRDELNGSHGESYIIVHSLEYVNMNDIDVLSSLERWQLIHIVGELSKNRRV